MSQLIVLMGPTAVGKSKLALELANSLNTEIISADSVQVYKKLDIGSAKIKEKEKYASDGSYIPHHLIDLVEPDVNFSVADFQELAAKKILELEVQHKCPLIVGGTGLYIQALTELYQFPAIADNLAFRKEMQKKAEERGNAYVHGLLSKIDQVTANQLHPNNLRRVIRALEVYEETGKPFSELPKIAKENARKSKIFCLLKPRATLYAEIDQRVEAMLAEGFLQEVKGLLSAGYDLKYKSMQSLGYRQLVDYLQGVNSYTTAVEAIKQQTRHYAKRQLTWFRRMEQIVYIDLELVKNPLQEILDKIPKDNG
ncbi:MAG: tRNA (adenosine(37)-N6)-dimethylallyltransferase MiaA [Clostridia bacterium]